MKRHKGLIDSIIDPDNLRLAFWKASKGKRYAQGVIHYGRELDTHLLDLRDQIIAGEVQVGDYHYFTIYDPKEREICASVFSEQVLHHSLMNICHPYFERKQIYDSYACRKGKGTYAALAKARQFTRRYRWYLKLDLRKYFSRIDHMVLKRQLRCMFKDWQLISIFDQIIDSYSTEPGRGLPIGNLSSQYFANHYLTGLDHAIKEQLGIKGYVRFMDDLVLWHQDKEKLKRAEEFINEYITSQLQSELKPSQLNRSTYGLPFLGYIVYPHFLKLTQRSKRRFIRKYHELEEKYHTGKWSESQCQQKILPLLAFIFHADTLKFRESVILQAHGSLS